MLLIAGLGNPGSEYAYHRHNIGFMAVDDIAERHGFQPWRSKFQGMVAEGRLGGIKTLLLKPTTYMNESGRSVGEAVRFFKLQPDEVVVIYDEIDLAPGKCRVKKGGGAAGHNGIRSIDRAIGPDFWRIRLGVGHPGDKALVKGYVLKNFAKADEDWLDPLLEAVADAAPLLVDGGEPVKPEKFQTKVALLTQAG
jgi:PTH1 family peptidyl-tRNA hydrolase